MLGTLTRTADLPLAHRAALPPPAVRCPSRPATGTSPPLERGGAVWTSRERTPTSSVSALYGRTRNRWRLSTPDGLGRSGRCRPSWVGRAGSGELGELCSSKVGDPETAVGAAAGEPAELEEPGEQSSRKGPGEVRAALGPVHEGVVAVPTAGAHGQQPRADEAVEVPAGGRRADPRGAGQLPGRAFAAVEQAVEHRAARAIADQGGDRGHVDVGDRGLRTARGDVHRSRLRQARCGRHRKVRCLASHS